MNIPPKPPMTEYPTPPGIPAVEAPPKLTAEQRLGIAEGRLDRFELRLDGFEPRLDGLEDRASKHSSRVQGDAESEAQQNEAIKVLTLAVATMKGQVTSLAEEVTTVKANQELAATERAETNAMVKQIRDTVVGTITNKKVVFVGKVIFAAAVAYSAMHGLKVLP